MCYWQLNIPDKIGRFSNNCCLFFSVIYTCKKESFNCSFLFLQVELKKYINKRIRSKSYKVIPVKAYCFINFFLSHWIVIFLCGLTAKYVWNRKLLLKAKMSNKFEAFYWDFEILASCRKRKSLLSRSKKWFDLWLLLQSTNIKISLFLLVLILEFADSKHATVTFFL